MGRRDFLGKAAALYRKEAIRMNDPDFRDFMECLKAACRGEEIAVAFGLRRLGNRFFCPSCQPQGGKSPDLVVFNHGFKCHKCGLKGDVIDLVVLLGRMSKPQAIVFLEKQSGIVRLKRAKHNSWRVNIHDTPDTLSGICNPREEISPIHDGAVHSALFDVFLKSICLPIHGTQGAVYLESRGISAILADQYGIRYCEDLSGLWNLADHATIKAAGLSSFYVFQKAELPFLVIPYFLRRTPVFIKTRCLLSKQEAESRQVTRFLNTGGKIPCLWNHEAIADALKVLICEGEIDALSAIGKGFVAVGLPGGSSWQNIWARDFKGKEVFLILDNDEAGIKGTLEIARSFTKAGLPCPRKVDIGGAKDLNEYLQSLREG
jgi:hypothetical protein